jgi:N-acetylglucosamine kinase-like BadF-type ATPase
MENRAGTIDRVGQERAIENLKSLLSAVVEGSNICIIGMPQESIEKNPHIAEQVKVVVNGPVEVFSDYVGASRLISDKWKAVVLNAGASAWCCITGSALRMRGGRTGHFSTVGSGEWIGRELYRKARELEDAGNKSALYFFRSIANVWIIDWRVVTSEDIKAILERYDELVKGRNELEKELKKEMERNLVLSTETKKKLNDLTGLELRLGAVQEYLESYRDAIVEYAETSQYVDWSSLVPLCEAIALDNNSGEAGKIARRILEHTGEGLAGLVEASIAANDNDDDGDVTRELTWFGGVFNVEIVRNTCMNLLQKNICNLKIDRHAADPALGLVRLAQHRMAHPGPFVMFTNPFRGY